MPEETLITDEIKKAIGKELDSVVVEIEKGAIKRMAEAVGDPNPLWQDEKYASKTKNKGIVAPPTFLASFRAGDGMTKLPALPLKRVLNGGNDLEYFLPIRPGDVITGKRVLADMVEQTGSMGRMVLTILETSFVNQKGEVVARGRQTVIRY